MLISAAQFLNFAGGVHLYLALTPVSAAHFAGFGWFGASVIASCSGFGRLFCLN